MSQSRAQIAGKNASMGDLSLFLDDMTSTSLDLNSIENAIRCLDAQLEENTASLEASWVKFMDTCNDISQASRTPSKWLNPEQAVELLTDPQFIESNMCIPEPMAINCFLNNVIQALERNPGHEEMILQDLVQFASEQGILLPEAQSVEKENSKPPGVSDHISDDDDNATRSLWEAIRKKLCRGLFSTMGKLPVSTNPEVILMSYAKRLDILQKLSFLFPGESIWEGCKHQRHLQVEKLISQPESLRSLEVDFVMDLDGVPGDAIMLAKLSKAIAIMIHEDYALIEEESLPPKILTLEYIYETYLTKFTRELSAVLEAHTDSSVEDTSDSLRLATSARRGSSFRRGSGLSIFGDNLKMYRYCYLASLSLELAVVQLMEQQEAKGLYDLSGIRSGHLSHMHASHSPTGSLKNLATRVSISGGSSTNIFACEDSLPPPFGHGPSHKPSTGHPSSSTGQSLGSQWPWRDEFKVFTSRISIAVAETIKKSCDRSIEEEIQQYQNNKKLSVVYIKDELIGGKHDYPKCITTCCSHLLDKADEVLPLASSHGSKVFQVVRSSFIDSLDTAFKTWHSRLSQLASDFPKNCSVDTVYLVLCNATFIRNHLAYYENVIGSEPRRPFPVLYKQYGELMDSVMEKIINYHDQTITTAVLQDAHSHNWNDQRAFYEDERCSFSIQMWNYYMQGLQQDLWKYCPPLKAQGIFTSVLHSSVSTITFRFSRTVPSYNRTKQFRSDITAVLLCMLNHLWCASKSLDAIMNQASRVVPFTTIHNLCSCLVANMVVVISPLETLCSKLTQAQKNNQDKSSGSRTSWLSIIYPEVFRNHEGSIKTLPDRQAVYVVFKLMINQPVPRWPLVVQALLMCNARLPVTIVKYGDLSIIGRQEEEIRQPSYKICSSWFEDLYTSASSKEIAVQETSLVMSLYWLIYNCSHETTGLSNFLMALVHREDSWTMFDSAGALKITARAESPVWLNCIYETFDSVLKRLLQPSLLLLCQPDKNLTKSYNFTSMSALPCGCPYNKHPRTNESRSQTEMVYQVLQAFIHHLTVNLTALPRVICQFLNRLQETLHEKSIDVNGRTAGLKILASNIYRWLMDADKISQVCDVKLSAATRKTIEVFARVVWHVLVDLKQDRGILDDPNLPTDLEFFINSKKEWFSTKVDQLKDFIATHSHEEYKVESVHQEVEEAKFANTASTLLKNPRSYSALKHVYSFLCSNKDWLMNFVLVPGHILPPSPAVNYGNLLSGERSSPFNSLRQYAMIGEWSFDQEKIATFPYDWAKLLQSDLGIPEPAVQRLVFNRFEMQEDAYLDDTEKELVQVLKSYYGMSSVEETDRCQDN